jgi:hypothetical protein
MSSKKKHQTQHQKQAQVESQPLPVKEEPVKEIVVPVVVEEYKPSLNESKYPKKNIPSYNYKILASQNDYIKLQEDVTRLLREGWKLAGGVSVALHVDPYGRNVIYSQAIFKEEENEQA